jgi:hypothetical protein
MEWVGKWANQKYMRKRRCKNREYMMDVWGPQLNGYYECEMAEPRGRYRHNDHGEVHSFVGRK